jgi:hypothetical protein
MPILSSLTNFNDGGWDDARTDVFQVVEDKVLKECTPA